VDSSHNTLITTGNGGPEPTKAQVTLFYNGGQNKYRVEKPLLPGQQIWLDPGSCSAIRLPIPLTTPFRPKVLMNCGTWIAHS